MFYGLDQNRYDDNNDTTCGFAVSERRSQKPTVDRYEVVMRELVENCTCPVCQETYTSSGPLQPKLLPGCCHSVCKGCADRLCREVESSPRCCPLCRHHFEVPFGGASKLLNNVDAIRSLNAIAQVQSLFCRRHPGSTEDICCLSCLSLLCAKCFVNDHAQHKVTSVEEAAKDFRGLLEKHIEEANTLDAHLATAADALKVVKDRMSEIRRQVLDEEKSKKERIEKDKAELLAQLLSRLEPLSRKVEDGQKSLNKVFQRYQTVVDNPRELVRYFPSVRPELQRLRQLSADITVEEIERRRMDFTPLCLTDWIPVDSVNLVGKLTPSSSDDVSDDRPPTLNELRSQLDASQKRESSLIMELQRMKEHQTVVNNRFSEQSLQHQQQEARMAERDSQLCQCIEILKTKAVQLDRSAKIQANRVEVASLEKTELERKMAAQAERLTESARRISELETQAGELNRQINAGEVRQRDLEEQLSTERKWRRNAEAESRQRRHDNEDLVAQIGKDRQNAERKYDELQDTVTTLLKNAKEQTRQECLNGDADSRDLHSSSGES